MTAWKLFLSSEVTILSNLISPVTVISIPVSSFVSLLAASSNFSPNSKCPPGKDHAPLNGGFFLSVIRIAKEDLFLLKGITERERDLEDMFLLAESGIDYDIVFEECKMQSEIDERGNIWEASLNEKLKELENSYGIRVPFRKALEKVAEDKMIGLRIVKALQIENLDEAEIYSRLPELEPDVIKYGLKNLTGFGRITKEEGKYRLVPNHREYK